MKKRMIILVVFFVFFTGIFAFAQLEDTYQWKEHTLTNVAFKENFPFSPENIKEGEEYSLPVVVTVSSELFEDEELLQQLYAQVHLVDTQGNLYSPGAGLSSEADKMLTYLFPIPNEVKKEDLSLTFEEVKEEKLEKLEILLEEGQKITLWPIDNKIFQELEDGIIIHTRLGNTVHHGGSVFTAGSAMRMQNMKNTQQFGSPMAAFAYTPTEDMEEGLNLLEKLAEKTILRVGEKEIKPEVLWLTEDKGCFIFSLMDLSTFDTLPAFAQEGDQLIITLP